MKIEPFRQRARVTEKYVPGAGATVSSRIIASVCTALVAPAPAFETSRKYLSRIPDRSAPDASQIGSASVADPERIGDRCTIDRNLIDRRIP